jgi:16S rRNA processing protein RimM
MSGELSLLHLGTVAGTHGIRGQLRIRTFSGEYEVLRSLSTVLLQAPGGAMEPFGVSVVSVHGRKALVNFAGIDSMNAALSLVGREVYMERSKLPPLPEGEYYWCDIVGLSVRKVDGSFLGTVTSVIPTGSNDVYVVQNGEREVLIPAIDGVVISIDPAAGEMVVDPLEGLLDL